MSKLLVRFISALVSAFLLAACSGSDSTSPTVNPPDNPTPTPPVEPPPVVTPPSTPTTPLVVGTLDSGVAPSGNFDLWSWYISIPTGSSPLNVKEDQLNAGYEHPDFFYTGNDGGMVFKCPVNGSTTSGSSYPRTELREMLRRGDTSISTQGVNLNNWVFSSAPTNDQLNAGGVDGNLRATLAVNHVTTTGLAYQVGRVIIGQIHANDDEPARLYYRKLPGNALGSVYFAHEPIGADDLYFELIGSRANDAANPQDGIELDEVFSYEIDVQGNILSVSILRDGKPNITETIDMEGSGYDQGGQYMYFKAGVYNQNNSGDPDDYVQATFYALQAVHN